MKILLLVIATVLLVALPALADFDVDQATYNIADCSSPNVASSDNGLTMIGFHDRGDPLLMSFAATQLVPTYSTSGETWPEPEILNSGGSPKICWTREGFVAAFASGPMVLVYHSDLEGNWDKIDYELMDPGADVVGIDLWGVSTDAAGPHVFMTVQVWENPPFGNYNILYAAGSAQGWTDFEVVAEDLELMPHPKITWSLGPAGPWPTIFYLASEPGLSGLVYTTKDLAAGWTPSEIVPGDGGSAPSPVEGPFDVVTYGILNRSVIGLGMQPTCPCGTIHHLEYEMGSGWSPQENLTSHHAEMDWPMPPSVAADPAGRIHAFWFQLGSDVNLQPETKTLEYWIKDEFGWTEAGGFLDGQENGPLGKQVALDVSPAGAPVLAWTRRDTLDGVPQPQQIWIARPHDTAEVPGSEISAVALSAWPNPFNPRVQLAMETATSGSARLDLYDLRGRLVIRLFEGFLAEGRREIAWDGRDADGRSAPSGVYFARLTTGAGRAVQKLVLAE